MLKNKKAIAIISVLLIIFLLYNIFFTNNGKKPESIVTEGGGLGSLRIRLEEVGGNMNIFTKPEFVLAVTLPEKGIEFKPS